MADSNIVESQKRINILAAETSSLNISCAIMQQDLYDILRMDLLEKLKAVVDVARRQHYVTPIHNLASIEAGLLTKSIQSSITLTVQKQGSCNLKKCFV